MEFREATIEDVDSIREVARASLEASYAPALDSDRIQNALEHWYNHERVSRRLEDTTVQYFVLEADGEIVGFSECEHATDDEVGELHWLHVHPDHRGHGYGRRLLEETERTLFERGVKRIEGYVLAVNEAGNRFYQEHGFHQTGDRTVDIGTGTITERTYLKLPDDAGPIALTEPRDLPDGTTVYVAYDERERGSKAPFYVAYSDVDREVRYGYYCANCNAVDVSMDTMERITCNQCENTRKPTVWDATYGG